ncbi:hypothetical protein HNQ39_004185 [Armatimonas rosea]|uniref:Uncharacterized protein n=1 Tax=Armatimonas rosea TaxID=685828 RepID=A0A7W9SUU5_ARMRO|nr:hypothetical protein [Armatimonas rosea]
MGQKHPKHLLEKLMSRNVLERVLDVATWSELRVE